MLKPEPPHPQQVSVWGGGEKLASRSEIVQEGGGFKLIPLFSFFHLQWLGGFGRITVLTQLFSQEEVLK